MKLTAQVVNLLLQEAARRLSIPHVFYAVIFCVERESMRQYLGIIDTKARVRKKKGIVAHPSFQKCDRIGPTGR